MAGLLGVALLMLLTRQIYDARTAVLAGCILATSYSYVFLVAGRVCRYRERRRGTGRTHTLFPQPGATHRVVGCRLVAHCGDYIAHERAAWLCPSLARNRELFAPSRRLVPSDTKISPQAIEGAARLVGYAKSLVLQLQDPVGHGCRAVRLCIAFCYF